VASLRASITSLFRTATTAVGDRANDDRTLQWVAQHVDALRIGGYVAGALALWFFNLTWLVFFLIALVVAAWEVGVAQLAGRAAIDEPHDGDDAGPLAPPTAGGSADPVAT
jgi:hypothetical protein